MTTGYRDKHPNVQKAAYIAPSADIIGEVELGAGSSVWFNATIRGDIAPITIGEGTNIQDNAVIHVNINMPAMIGEQVTVGHGAIIHACTIGDFCLIGMGAVVLDKAVIGDHCLVAAGSLVPPNKVFPPKSLVMGSPARVKRELTAEELTDMEANAKHYIELASVYAGPDSKG